MHNWQNVPLRPNHRRIIMWKNFALTPRISYSILWSIPIWIFLHIQNQSWFPGAVIDWLLIMFFSFVTEYVFLHRLIKSLNNKEARKALIDILSYVCFLLLLYVLSLLLFLVLLTGNQDQLAQKAGLAYAYVFLAVGHTACQYTRYTFGRYGSI